MVFHDVEPLSPEWRALRLGIPTASNFHKLLTPKKLEASKSAIPYMNQLLAEWITGEETEGFKSEWMQRGNDVEDQIWKAYEGFAEVETSRGGFFTTDDGLIGCSPDRLVGTVGDLEAKAPMIQTMVGYALNGADEDYILQLQGRLWIHERDWVDIFAWHPKLFIPPLRVVRDEKVIAAISAVVRTFRDLMLEKRLILEQRYGPFTRPEPEQPVEYPEFLSEADGEAIIAALQESV